MEIPWPLLQWWSNFRENNSRQNVNYVDLLNATVISFVVKSGHVKELLGRKSAAVKLTYRRTDGRKRAQVNNNVNKVSVLRGGIESIEKIKSELIETKDELEEYKKKCSDLEEEKNKLLEQMMIEKDTIEQKISDLKLVNKELVDYVETLEKRENLNCQGSCQLTNMRLVRSKREGDYGCLKRESNVLYGAVRAKP